ncbi:MAG: SDR family NAD(P)-dependent oxidoreductase [Bacteroidales bacterium]|nr:SDR family NAD(P)-dependent oxidoreductase [Bacteroidales bacterium]
MTALVTGAAKGIGKEYALQLAAKGYDLVLVDKDPSVLEAAAEIGASGVAARAIVSDLARIDAAQEIYDDVVSHGESIDILVNNAGEFSFRDIVNVTVETVNRTITLHDITLTHMNRLFAKDMAERGGGHILNMSSYSIWMPLPGVALYSASKAYVKSFSTAFSKEVRDKGIYVTAICPAGVATDLYGLSPKFQALGLKTGALITPKACARRALRALFRHRRCSVPDWWNRLWIPLLTHLPNWLENLIHRKTLKFQK